VRTTPVTEETAVTDGQKKELRRHIEEAIEKSGLDKDGIQRVLARGGEFQSANVELLCKLGRPEENPFKDEKVSQSYYYYPQGWAVPSIVELKERTAKLFEGIDLSHVDELAGSITVPANADGIALIPKIAYLGKLWGIEDPYGSGYCQVVVKVVELLGNSRAFYNYREGELGENYIRLHEQVKHLLKQKEDETPGDVLVLPFNFGNLYAGYSARNARWESLHSAQLPLGSAQVGCLLLVMPERLVAYENLFIDCPGDEYNWGAGGGWSHYPYFYFRDDQLEFYADYSDGASGGCGSAVAFRGV